MNAIQRKLQLIRRFICATCLSRDRKMFPVSVEMIRCGLNVQAHDFVCWECCHFLFKVIAFRRKAKRAQVLLNEWANGKVNTVDSLSNLGESTGLVIDIQDIPVEEKYPYNVELVKQEVRVDDDLKFEAADAEPIYDEESESAPNKGDIRKAEPKKTAEVNEHEPFYNEEIMTEDEMLGWRKRKKVSVIYTSTVPTYRCEKCIKGFDNGYAASYHMRKHTEEWGTLFCVVCQQRRKDETALNQHIATHFRLFTCRICGLEWDDVNVIREHGAAEHGRPVEYRRCALCLKEIKDYYAFFRHLKTHGSASAPKPELVRPPPVEYQCDYCKQLFKRKKNVASHISNRHGGEEKCNICKKVFENKFKLKNHMKQTHRPRGPPAICDQCGKSYTNKNSLLDHINTHTGARPYACTHCDATFAYKSCLYLHGRYKHNPNRKTERKQEKKKKK